MLEMTNLSMVNIPVDDEDARDSLSKSSPGTESHLGWLKKQTIKIARLKYEQ